MRNLPVLVQINSFLGILQSLVAWILAVLGSSPITPAPTPVASPPGSLVAASPPDFAIGAVLHGYDPSWNQGDYAGVAQTEFNAITATWYMGFNGFTASGFEDVVDFAVSNNQLVHGHALLYPYANEAYWRDHPDDDTTSTVQAFLNLACSTRKGKVWLWDVVNEVFGFPGVHDMDDQGLRTEFREYTDIGNSPGDYIPLAFQWARECDPDATLILLEAGAEELSDVSDNMFSYVVRQRENGVPIDGVGFQMHVWGPQPDIPIKDWESVRANLERFANAGFRIFITEMDVMSAADSPPTVSQLQVQAEIFRTVSRLATTYSESLLLWDYADDRSWMHPSPFQLYDFPIGTFFYPTPWYDSHCVDFLIRLATFRFNRSLCCLLGTAGPSIAL